MCWDSSRIICTKAYIDEKWIEILTHWYYWFAILDIDTGLPVYQTVLKSRSTASVSWIVTELQRLKQLPKVFVTDGLASYKSVFAGLTGVKHVLCRFHQQQGVCRWLNDHFPADIDVPKRKAVMKKVFQTPDKRTVKRRFARLKERVAAGSN